MSAVLATLLITEILEQILSELPPLEIIRCQCVNSTWRKLVDSSPLLQYKTWLRNDLPDSNQHVRPDDLMWHFTEGARFGHMERYLKDQAAHEMKRYVYDVSKHLNPIVVARIMQNPPNNPSHSFDPLKDMEKDGFGGYFNFRPVLIRDLRQWYEKNRESEHIWGNMSLYRPDARKIEWETSTSEDAGIPWYFEVVREEDFRGWTGRTTQIKKKPGESLILTLSDLMGRLDDAWNSWIDAENEEHYLSHDGRGCDFDLGIPAKRCLGLNRESGDEDENDKEEKEEDEYESETFGYKMTMEEHIEQAMWAASA